MNILVKKCIGFLNYITFTGMDKSCFSLISTYVSHNGFYFMLSSPTPAFLFIESVIFCYDSSPPLFALNNIGNILWNSRIWWSPFLTASLGFIWESESSLEEAQVGWWTSPKAATRWLGNRDLKISLCASRPFAWLLICLFYSLCTGHSNFGN